VNRLLQIDHARAAHLMRLYGDAVAVRRRARLMLFASLLVCTLVAAWAGEVDLAKFWSGLPRFWTYLYDILPTLRPTHLLEDFGQWFWNWDGWLGLLAETLLVAYVGTFLGGAGAFVFCFCSSANLMRSAWLRFIVRRTFEFCRTVPDIVFALLLVYAMGLGPIPGVLAIAIHTFGALGKQFAEVV
jgi:phosphonate transport system permease protein